MQYNVATDYFLNTAYHVSCGGGWVSLQRSNSCYKFVTEDKQSWVGAQGMCQKLGGKLATLESADDICWLRGYRSFHPVLRPSRMWLGGHREGGKWLWKGSLADTAITFSDWGTNEPHGYADENCMAMFGDDAPYSATKQWFRWLNVACQFNYGYICKKIVKPQ